MTAPVLVAGGGIAGAAAALALARAGVPVTVVERAAGPADKICGEFVSGEAVAALRSLGVDPVALGGTTITHVRLARGAKVVTAKLPFLGVGLSRQVLDEALLRRAEALGASVLRGRTVRAVSNDALVLQGETLKGRAVLLATGKHEMRGAHRAGVAAHGLVGFKMYFWLRAEARAALAGHVELIMFPDGYAGLQMVEGGRANLCLLVAKQRLARVGGWDGLLAWLREISPHLGGRLEAAAALLEAPLTIARVPYGFVCRESEDGVFRLGDQAGVIQSFTGDGMAIALHSAARAVAAMRRGEAAAVFQRRLAGDVAGQIGRAGAIFRAANAAALQPMVFGAARLWPAGLALAARATRVQAGGASGGGEERCGGRHVPA